MPELDQKTVEIKCDTCGRKARKTIRWVRENAQYTCPTCGSVKPVAQEALVLQAKKVTSVVSKAIASIFVRKKP